MTPKIFFIAGCNGTGKTTFINSTFSDNLQKIDPDLIKKENNCSEIDAGKIAINLTNYYLNNQITFIRESTLTSNLDFKILEISKKLGYKSILFYIGVSDSMVLIDRIRCRVSAGGHDIPKDTVIRRFYKSINNLIKAIPLFDKVIVYDNTENKYKKIISFQNSEVQDFTFCPTWFEKVAQQLNIPSIHNIYDSPDNDYYPHQ